MFNTIGLISRPTSDAKRQKDIRDTLLLLTALLKKRKLNTIIENETATQLAKDKSPTYPREQLAQHCDLIIVVGGDGSLLNAARAAVDYGTPVLGINRGRLGFLTDIHPGELDIKVNAVLNGDFVEEKRFLLNIEIKHKQKTIAQDIALNDVVLMPGDIAHMIEFAITIDEQFVCSQRADGLITATPTGSTAYSLSGGGPILHPNLDAVVLVPMFPHTLTARPIVIHANSKIIINIPAKNENTPRLSCDGQAHITLPIGADIHIQKKSQPLRLIHPKDYNYFETLRNKLHWHSH
jgi:NAD+ kinase